MKITLKEIPMDKTVQGFFDRAEKSGLERREGQFEMSQEVTDAILGKYPLAVEAGVGIGKSFAYLAPLVLNFYRERRQVIIATSTIALQEQLERDIHTVLKMIGVKAEAIVATGMKNYVCRRRLERMLRHNKDDTMKGNEAGYLRQHLEQGVHKQLRRKMRRLPSQKPLQVFRNERKAAL